MTAAGAQKWGRPWSEVSCLKKLRFKSRPGLTAFAPHSVAYILLALDAAAARNANTVAADHARTLADESAEGDAVADPAPLDGEPLTPRHAVRQAELSLTYLSSYDGMGIARARCVRGCVCGARVIDAHRGSVEAVPLASVYKTENLRLRLDTACRCVLELRVLNRTRSNGFKFKVAEIALVARVPKAARNASECGGAERHADANARVVLGGARSAGKVRVPVVRW